LTAWPHGFTTFYNDQTESPGGRYQFEAPVDQSNWLVPVH